MQFIEEAIGAAYMTKQNLEKILLRAVSCVRAEQIGLAKELCENAIAILSRHIQIDEEIRNSSISRNRATVTNSASTNAVKPNLEDEQLTSVVDLYKQGKLAMAAEQARLLTQQFPSAVQAWNVLGVASAGLRRMEEAERAFSQACTLQPTYAGAHSNLGNALQAQNKLDEAISAYERAIAIKPDHADANYNLGNAMQAQNKLNEAVTAFQRAIAIKPNHAGAHNNLGNALKLQSRLDEAIASYQRAIAIKPDYLGAHYSLGSALQAQNRLNEAIIAYERVIAIKPDHANAYNNLGAALQAQNKLAKAIIAYEQAIAVEPSYANAHYNLGCALQAQNKLDEAISAYERAIAIKPDHASAHYNLGNALKVQTKLDEAIISYERAIAIKPDHASARFSRSLAYLVCGEMRTGFEDYEWRWKLKNFPKARSSNKPIWIKEQPLEGRTILLWGEQGLGDQIQFARYVPLVVSRGARVVLEVNEALVGLFRGMSGVTKVSGQRSPVPDDEFDFHCPLMSLPISFGTDLLDIPQPQRLTCSPEHLDRWSKLLVSKSPKIGIVWSGNTAHKNDHNRSLLLNQLSSLFELPVSWISLQKEVRDVDRGALSEMPSLSHFGGDLKDFSETAALCEHCDLVISVDTSVAHLAATLGRPVWLMLPNAPDWRWLLDQHDSPWYPTMKLYRQQQIGDWGGVIERVKADLITWLSEKDYPTSH